MMSQRTSGQSPHPAEDVVAKVLATSVGRRAALALGLKGAAGLWSALGAVSALGLFSSLQGCYRAPGTARDQLIFISEDKEITMGVRAFREVLRQAPLASNPEVNELVNKVGRRIADVANKPEYHWEFAVIHDDQTINAFCLPGGKVAVFTGILKVTQNEAGLATVMGHEIAHALQRHGAERMSRSVLEQIAQLGALAGAATGAVRPDVMQGLQSAYGIGVSLPFNRKQESEADLIGLRLMASAGYDPHEAVPFWERMSGCPRNMIGKLCFRSAAAIPEFLSTHPSDITRINQIEAWIPDALRFYQPPHHAPTPPQDKHEAPLFGPMPKSG